MSELTARPWEWSREQGGDIVIHGPPYPDSESSSDIVLADREYLSEEEAALIVKAVNSHDRLVEALEYYASPQQVNFSNEVARAALEEAKA